MKKSILKPAILILLLVPAMTVLSQSDEEIKAEIEKINSKMAEAMIAGDYNESLRYYADDVISMPSYGPMIHGIEKLRESNQEMAGSGMQVLSFEAMIKKVKSCDDMIIEIGKYKISTEMPGMEEPVKDHGKYLTVWEKQSDGSLKIKIEIWNTDVNPWMENHEEM